MQILQPDVNVPTQTLLGDVSLWNLDQVLRRHLACRVFMWRNLIWLGHVLIENFFCNSNQTRMSDPCAIVARFYFTKLVTAHFVEGLLVRGFIIANWNLRRHSAHGMNAAPMTDLNQQIDVGTQKMSLHRDLRSVGENEFRTRAEFLDIAENVVPPAAVEPGRMLAQFVKDLVHFESGDDLIGRAGRIQDARGIS